MVDDPAKSFENLVRSMGKYPEEAFFFVREGLSFAAEAVHGPETEAHQLLQSFLAKNDLDWDDLVRMYHANELPESLEETIAAAGGHEKLNRHVSGRELCWALRDFALKRWGILAKTVLDSWNITATEDFGRIVFGFIDFDMMRKQPDDSLDDFKEVYSFHEVFDVSYIEGIDGHRLDETGHDG